MDVIGQYFLIFWGAIGLDADLMSRYGPRILDGLWVTLQIVFISTAAGFVLAFPIAIARIEGGKVLSGAALAFSTFFRGTPLLAQVFLVYYGAGQFREALDAAGVWWIFREAYWCVIITFTLNTAAYQAEIIRGGVKSVPRGHREAGYALGLRLPAIYRLILLPQALTQGLRPLGNELVLMIKASSIASVVTVYDILGMTRLAFSRSVNFEVYLWAALIYLILVEVIRRVWIVLENRMTRHLKRRTA